MKTTTKKINLGRKILWCSVGVVLASVIALQVADPSQCIRDALSARRKAVQSRIKAAVVVCDEKNRKAYEELEKELDASEAPFSRACTLAAAGTEKLVEVKTCAKLTKCLITDYIKEETQAMDMIDRILCEPVVDECKAAVKQREKAFRTFLVAVEQHSDELAAACREELAVEEGSVGILAEQFGDFEAQATGSDLVVDISSKGVGQMVALGFGAVLLPLDVRDLTRLVMRSAGMKSLKALAKRAAVRTGASGTAALCDGPLPIGDIIGAVVIVGGTVWDAYEINKIRGELRDGVREQMVAQIDQLQQDSRNEVLKQAAAVLCNAESNAAKVSEQWQMARVDRLTM